MYETLPDKLTSDGHWAPYDSIAGDYLKFPSHVDPQGLTLISDISGMRSDHETEACGPLRQELTLTPDISDVASDHETEACGLLRQELTAHIGYIWYGK